jgi:ATP-dependent DNA helicase DinG
VNASSPPAFLASALVVLPGPKCAVADAVGARVLPPAAARALAEAGPVLVAHAAMTARRLGLQPPVRSRGVLDVLELYAFVRPARFSAPSAAGLAQALGLPEPSGAPAQAAVLHAVCRTLLDELGDRPWPSREEALNLAETLDRAGWAWGPSVVNALRSRAVGEAGRRGKARGAWQADERGECKIGTKNEAANVSRT